MILLVRIPTREDRDVIEELIEQCSFVLLKKKPLHDQIKETFYDGVKYPFPLGKQVFDEVAAHVNRNSKTPESIKALYVKFLSVEKKYRLR